MNTTTVELIDVDVPLSGEHVRRWRDSAEDALAPLAAAALSRFLAGVRIIALGEIDRAGTPPLTPASLDQLWAGEIEPLIEAVPPEYRDTLTSVLSTSSIPGQAYSTARAVLNEAAERDAPRSDVVTALDQFLTPDGHAAQQAPVDPALTAALSLSPVGIEWSALPDRDVRTFATRMAGEASIEGMRAKGVPSKRWVSRNDARVRDVHDLAHGQTVPLDVPFIVGGEPLRYPGDPLGSAFNIINCRCYLAEAWSARPSVR